MEGRQQEDHTRSSSEAGFDVDYIISAQVPLTKHSHMAPIKLQGRPKEQLHLCHNLDFSQSWVYKQGK